LVEAFQTIANEGDSYIVRDSLLVFLEQFQLFADENDLDAIFRRLDHDNDEMLSYNEFEEALTYIVPTHTNL
jgi:Ca2+-binding EF-hand superfamily protein